MIEEPHEAVFVFNGAADPVGSLDVEDSRSATVVDGKCAWALARDDDLNATAALPDSDDPAFAVRHCEHLLI